MVYALHGYSIGAEQWIHQIHVLREDAFAQGAKLIIFVLPESKTAYNGSMYSSSATAGDVENHINRDTVAWIDAHYRAIPGGSACHFPVAEGRSRIGCKAGGDRAG
jgi:hypothetical protein